MESSNLCEERASTFAYKSVHRVRVRNSLEFHKIVITINLQSALRLENLPQKDIQE